MRGTHVVNILALQSRLPVSLRLRSYRAEVSYAQPAVVHDADRVVPIASD